MIIFYRRLVFIYFLLFTFYANAQTCSINSSNDVCIGNNISFSPQFSSGTPSSYDWNFGDGSSSVNSNPLYLYNKTGVFNVTLIIQFNGGGSCTASKSITVHALPKARFFIDNTSKNFCFYKNNICIRDTSEPSVSTNIIKKRTFLWGDGGGKVDSNANVNNSVGCYKYGQTGTYKLLMEIADNKGCVSKDSQTITILPDVKSEFWVDYSINNAKDCKDQVCFYNTSLYDSALLDKYYWILKEEGTFSHDFKTFCKIYDTAGIYKEKLVLENKNGCKDTFTVDVNINPIDFKYDITLPKKVCVGTSVLFNNLANNPGATEFGWSYRDSTKKPTEIFLIANRNTANFVFTTPGKYYISYNIKRNPCIGGYYDSIEVLGPIANFSVLNGRQCSPKDSVIFCDSSSNGYKSYNVVREYDFKYGDSCFTDIHSGTNLYTNCRKSNEINAKHWYDFSKPGKTVDCFTPKLTLTDTVNKCSSEFFGTVLIGKPTAKDVKLNYSVKEPCTDTVNNALRMFSYSLNIADCQDYWDGVIIYDSAKGAKDDIKSGIISKAFSYANTVDPRGYVTIGIVLFNGHKDFYKDCGQLDRTNEPCLDTIWFHNFIRVFPEPNADFDVTISKYCAPLEAEIILQDTIQYGLKTFFIDFGDGESDTIIFNPTDTLLPVYKHTYKKPGEYSIFTFIQNEAKCAEGAGTTIKFGYYNLFTTDTLVCKGDTIELIDSVHYLDDTLKYYWRDTVRAAKGLEKIWWDFDDGLGFSAEGSKPKHVFKDTGIYYVKMATKDSTGCRDTFTRIVRVIGFDVKIYIDKDTFVCDDNIVQFYDSTVFPSFFANDSVVSRLWVFDGDKRYLKDPFYDYNSYGLKRATLTVKTLSGCESTGEKYVFIKGPTPKYLILSDSIGCAPFTVRFQNLSGKANNFIWYSGDTTKVTFNTDSLKDFVYTYQKAGRYFIRLISTDSIFNPITGNIDFCVDSTSDFEITVQAVPKVDFEMPERICKGEPFTINSLADSIYIYHYYYFNNTDTLYTPDISEKFLLKKAGDYDVWYKPRYLINPPLKECRDSIMKHIVITPITSRFTINPLAPPYFQFQNTSIDGVRYKWDFGDYAAKDNYSNEFSPIHNYQNRKGKFLVCLVAYNYLDCPDTSCATLENYFEPTIIIPNVFTPGGKDTLNNRFDIDCFGELFYDLKIYNRWGELVFTSDIDGIGNTDINNWDGTKFNKGNECPAGEYFVVLDYELNGYDKKQYKGTITLIRE